jgi:protein archease
LACMERSVEVIEHPGEVRLRLRAGTFGELAVVAAQALARLELGREVDPTAAWREITVRGRDREALLVNWLNELIYCAETERWVGTEFAPVRETDTELVMRARGATVETAPSQVKAATFHGLRITGTGDGVEADLVLDV